MIATVAGVSKAVKTVGENVNTVKLTLYKWGGSWGPFNVKIPCGECALTEDIIHDVLKNELSDVPVKFEHMDWLSVWWRPLLKGGWHAPIVMVNNKVIFQGGALNRGLLTQSVIECYSRTAPLTGSHVYGKDTCPYCRQASSDLKKAEIEYEYHDVIVKPRALYDMLARVKPIIGDKVPVTVPQIWIKGVYVGGADALKKYLLTNKIIGEQLSS